MAGSGDALSKVLASFGEVQEITLAPEELGEGANSRVALCSRNAATSEGPVGRARRRAISTCLPDE